MKVKRIKLVGSICMLVVLILTSFSPVFAEEINNTSIDMIEVEREWENADRVPVQNDKNFPGNTNGIGLKAMGSYPTRKGVILVTPDKLKGIIPTGHAAIIYTADSVVESLQEGVTKGKNNWNSTKSVCYGVTVQGTTVSQDSEAANWCNNQIGKPYNWNYINSWTRDKFYCSQLVYAAYLDKYNINLDTASFGVAVHPMELVNSNNTIKIYEK